MTDELPQMWMPIEWLTKAEMLEKFPMSRLLQTNKPRRMRVPAEANWGQAYTIYRRTGIDHSDAAYRADERDRKRGLIPGHKSGS